jgi:aminopeptidase-like protein
MKKPAEQGQMMELLEALYPICRSITGNGVRETLKHVEEWIPLEIVEVPSGTPAFDWTVPDEWNVSSAYIADKSGKRVVDFADSSLHLLNYSEPFDGDVSREELEEHLFSLPDHPEWIPYRTSYYARNWGFCLPHSVRESLSDETYHVYIDSTLEPGHLTYGECYIPGREAREILLFTHVCHPALANDNLSGIAVAAAVARQLRSGPELRYSYRFVFAPGTIGSIVWLSQNKDRLENISHGLVLGLLGDEAPHTYKQTRHSEHEIDRVAAHVLRRRSENCHILPFSPYGYDERQFGSPGIDLPVGRLTRSVNGGYPEYHTSADNLGLVSEERLEVSVGVVTEILQSLEQNRYFVNLEPNCEPQLGKRGLYRATGGEQIADRENAILWLLNQSDGEHSVLEIATKSGIAMDTLHGVAEELVAAGLLQHKS